MIFRGLRVRACLIARSKLSAIMSMMTTKFFNILVITIGNHRKLAKPLNNTQIQYLKALELKPECFTGP